VFATAAGTSSSGICLISSDGTTTLTLTTHRTAGRVALRLAVTDQHGNGRAGQTVAGPPQHLACCDRRTPESCQPVRSLYLAPFR
jgi:hypothetical protein